MRCSVPRLSRRSGPNGVSCRTCGRWWAGGPARWRPGARGRRGSTRRGAEAARQAHQLPAPHPSRPRPPPAPPTRCTRVWPALPRPTAACNHTIRLNNIHLIDSTSIYTRLFLQVAVDNAFPNLCTELFSLMTYPGVPLQFVQD